ncbi:uncharacterized protein LOC123677156 [Harmonia axyridis]|uniref:uncharacterized protein LOC123677156 n=1 Tax=Harmonia axyridis TaxID=115357 RepID=UPI001E275CC8|nr:uncharacterized protein LOC123677156 [Harmonia axyridis]
MFWDDWDYRDFQVYGIFVALGILLVWNIILTILLVVYKLQSRNKSINGGDITTTKIATSPVWNQMYVPKIPRVQKPRSNTNTISSIPQSPSEWFGDGPAKMDQNVFF